MPLFWFLAGMLTTLAGVILLLPLLRRIPRFAALPALPWLASVAALVIVAATFGLSSWVGHPTGISQLAAPTVPNTADTSSGAFGNAARAFGSATSATGNAPGESNASRPANTVGAGSMANAVANLESRLAKGGGTAGDWELLAKSFEFLDRPADAIKARARQLPPLNEGTAATASGPSANAGAEPAAPALGNGTTISGEVTLAEALRGKAVAGETLFIVAKSVDAPGIPVAVFRGSVGSWPVKFTLDDSQSMLPGRNLSSAGRVTIEARISRNGQPLPAAGDLQGSKDAINPADHRPLKILIDHVVI